MPSGRLRLAILAATVAAFLLVPVAAAQAAAGVEHLKVDAEGSGSGKFVSTSEGGYKGVPPINCTYEGKGLGTVTGPACELLLSDEGEGWEQAFLGAVADPGSEFIEWTVENYEFEGCGKFGGCAPFVEPPGSGGDNGVAIARFCLEGQTEEECLATGPEFPTPLTILRTGEGTVTSSPSGIECGATCSAEFEKGETVTLTASPASGWAFGSWSGCVTHVGLTCTVTMSAAKTVKASFVATPFLTIEKTGSGSGKVSSKGISCDASCSVAKSTVKTGSGVEVKVTPSKGTEAAVFESGTGNASACTGGTCSFTISEDSSVKVKFAATPTKTVALKLTGPGAYKGKVKGKAFVKGLLLSGLNCASGCTATTESFFSTDEVELSASASTGYTFAGWSVTGGSAGTCTGTTSPCKLATNANKTVSAEFK